MYCWGLLLLVTTYIKQALLRHPAECKRLSGYKPYTGGTLTWKYFSINCKGNFKKQNPAIYTMDFFPGQVPRMNWNNMDKPDTSLTFPPLLISDTNNPKTPEVSPPDEHSKIPNFSSATFFCQFRLKRCGMCFIYARHTECGRVLNNPPFSYKHWNKCTFIFWMSSQVASYKWSVIFQCPTTETRGIVMECLHGHDAGMSDMAFPKPPAS